MQNKIKLWVIIIFQVLIISLNLINIKPAYAIKIGLLTNVHQAYLASSTSATLIDGNSGERVFNISPMQIYTIKSNGSTFTISSTRQSYRLNSNFLRLKADAGGFVFTKSKWYRDNLVLYNTNNGITVINDVKLENYLMGVVPSEMPSSWNIEAHKAQAIAARSYAIANLGKRARYGYDLKDTPEDQAYGGASRESRRTNSAVENTKGLVLVYDNKVIPAYYHSSSGGYTVNAGSVWFKDLPFVKSVPSFDGNIPKNGHGIGMSQYGANFLAKYGYNAYQILGYFYQHVQLYRLNENIM